MRYTIEGTARASGRDAVMHVDAASEADARQQAAGGIATARAYPSPAEALPVLPYAIRRRGPRLRLWIALCVTLLAVGLGGFTWGVWSHARAERERAAAMQRAAQAQAAFLRASLVEAAAATGAGPETEAQRRDFEQP